VGNSKADEFAKMAARMVDVPGVLLKQHVQHSQLAERVASTVAAIQLRRLQARPRTDDGGAVKERRRELPGLPWRIRAKGTKRSRPHTAGITGAGPAVGPFRAGDFLQMQPGAWPAAAVVLAAVQDDVAPADGLHNLVAQGPWPPQGSCRAVNGRLAGLWSCTVCGKRAADSSRAVELARKLCRAAGWLAEAAMHDLQEQAGALRCSRCGLHTTAQHSGQVGRSKCPVPRLLREGLAWPEGEVGLRSLLGRIRGYRRWCEKPDLPADSGAANADNQALGSKAAVAAAVRPACSAFPAGAGSGAW
jgi:hypothetical protein